MNNHEIQHLNSPINGNADISNLHHLMQNPQPNSQGAYDQLNQLFSEQDKQQKDVQEAREILGKTANDLSDSQVFDLLNEIQYLVDSWLEEFERKTFDGKTLNELLNIEP